MVGKKVGHSVGKKVDRKADWVAEKRDQQLVVLMADLKVVLTALH